MNVYDFDKTVYRRDSTADFLKHCLKRYPRTWLALPGAGFAALGKALGLIPLETMKGRIYRIFRAVPDVPAEVGRFWDRRESGIYDWYLRQKAPDDLIISASPEFLIAPICARLGVRCLASPVDPQSGALLGPNCKGEEKVRRLREAGYPDPIDRFYSDSLSDTPLARLAREAKLVSGETQVPWPDLP